MSKWLLYCLYMYTYFQESQDILLQTSRWRFALIKVFDNHRNSKITIHLILCSLQSFLQHIRLQSSFLINLSFKRNSLVETFSIHISTFEKVDIISDVCVGWALNRLPHAQCFLNTCFARFPTDYVAICGKRLWLLPDNISLHEISLMTSEIAEIYSNILDVFGADVVANVSR